MAADISGLLTALKQWRRAVKRLRKQGKSLGERDSRVEATRQQVLAQITAPAVAAEIDELIQAAIAPDAVSLETARETLIQQREPIVVVEMQTIHPLNISRKDLELLISTFLQSQPKAQPIADSQVLAETFAKLSLRIPQEYKALADLSRKEKKRRRRDLTLGTLHTVIGLGLLAGNTQIQAAASDYSYILGGNALLQAMQAFVGRVESSI